MLSSRCRCLEENRIVKQNKDSRRLNQIRFLYFIKYICKYRRNTISQEACSTSVERVLQMNEQRHRAYIHKQEEGNDGTHVWSKHDFAFFFQAYLNSAYSICVSSLLPPITLGHMPRTSVGCTGEQLL